MPEVVARAFEAILEEAGTTPTKLTTDKGGEFSKQFRALVESRGIQYKVKDNQRQIATIDVAIWESQESDGQGRPAGKDR